MPETNLMSKPIRRRDRTAAIVYEERYVALGKRYIVGMDEVGYGAWAGPMIVAAVCLPLDDSDTLLKNLHGVKDSKQMTRIQREKAATAIEEHALVYGFGDVNASFIDDNKLVVAQEQAYDEAFSNCVDQFPHEISVILLDGKRTWRSCPYEKEVIVDRIPKGDTVSLSIAAASVLAKVTRDAYMCELSKEHPLYEFEQHKGYGTKQHLALLKQHGVLRNIHRYSYRPIRQLAASMS